MTAVELGAKIWVERPPLHCAAPGFGDMSDHSEPGGPTRRLRSARQRASPQLARQPLAGGRLAAYCTAHGIFLRVPLKSATHDLAVQPKDKAFPRL